MSEGTTPADCVTADFKISLADCETYRTQAQRRRHAGDDSGDDMLVVMYLVAGLAIAAGLIAFAVGAVADIRNPTVPLLCGVAYYVGRYIEGSLAMRRRLRAWRKALKPLLETPYTIALDADGVTLSASRFRHWSSWERIRETTSREGLIVFWPHEADGFFLPRRAVSDEDASRVFSLARTAQVKTG